MRAHSFAVYTIISEWLYNVHVYEEKKTAIPTFPRGIQCQKNGLYPVNTVFVYIVIPTITQCVRKRCGIMLRNALETSFYGNVDYYSHEL